MTFVLFSLYLFTSLHSLQAQLQHSGNQGYSCQCDSAHRLYELISEGTIEPCRDRFYEIFVTFAVLLIIFVSAVKSLVRKGYVGPMSFTTIVWITLVLITVGFRTVADRSRMHSYSSTALGDVSGRSESVCESRGWLDESRIPAYSYMPAGFLAYSLGTYYCVCT
jgi:hypothetical protein